MIRKHKFIRVLLAAAIVSNCFHGFNVKSAEKLRTASELLGNYSKVSTSLDSNTETTSGYIPTGIKIKKSSNLHKATTFPASYDLRNQGYGYVTPVRNQGALNTCWTFSTYGSMESIEKKRTGTSYDFSEINMAVNNGETTPNQGGNDWLATAYLTSWKGPVYESDDPYPNPPIPTNVNPKYGLIPRFHVQDVTFIPGRIGDLDNERLKDAIMTYGAVSSSYSDDGQYHIDKGYAAYYNFDPNSINDINHAITLVGWDDNFSRNNFGQTPPGDGAFLVKNSWGSAWGDSGYFYISYYDKSLGYDMSAVYKNFENTNNYLRMYSPYDKTYSAYYQNNNFSGNIFTASASEIISAAGFYTYAENVGYEVYVEQIGSNSNIYPTKLAATGTLTEAGYHTVKLANKLSVAAGEKFLVAVKLTGDIHTGTNLADASNSRRYINGGVYASGLAFAINAYTENSLLPKNLSINNIEPSGEYIAYPGGVTLTFDDNIAQGTSFNSISVKNENDFEINKGIALNGNKLIITDKSLNHTKGSLKIFIPKDAIKSSSGTGLSSDFSKDYTIYNPTEAVVFTDNALEQAVRAKIGKSTGTMTAQDMMGLTELYADGLSISNLNGLQYALNLFSLGLSDNSLTSVEPLRNLRKLQILAISNNNVQDLAPLSGIRSLENLEANNNKIANINPLINCSNLTNLVLRQNQIEDISGLSNLLNLEYIYIDDNRISNIDPLINYSQNKLKQRSYVYLANNYLDFAYGSKASNVLSVLGTNNVNAYGATPFEQHATIKIISINNSSSLLYNRINIEDKITITLSEASSLSSNYSSLITLKNASLDYSNYFTYEVQDNKLIMTPKQQLPINKDFVLTIDTGFFVSKNNPFIKSQYATDINLHTESKFNLNGDTSIDIADLALLAQAYNAKQGTSNNWNSKLDFNSDGIINLYDMVKLSLNIK